MTATILDGRAILARSSANWPSGSPPKRSLPARTVLLGADPASAWCVGAKHRDCAEIGITSIRLDLPAGATQAEIEGVIDQLNADPCCAGFLVQQPTGLDEFALLTRVDPSKDVDGLHPVNFYPDEEISPSAQGALD